MKRISTSLILLIAAITAMAKTYTANLKVSVGGTTSSSQSTIDVTQQADGTYKLTLADFVLGEAPSAISVGTINIQAEANDMGKYKLLHADQDIKIEAGSTPQPWIGPTLGNVPVKLLAKQTEDNLYAVISINFSGLDIKVQFGDGYQVPNADFELFGSNNEPLRWHSFQTVTGSWAGSAKWNAAISSNDTRPGTTGTKSVLIKSRRVIWVIANGTLTTGRLNAGSMFASDTDNNSFLDITKTDKDTNGNPFYTEFQGQPDRMTLWYKFKQSSPNSTYPNATVKAVITDGSYYQLPEDKTYNNKTAQAINNDLKTTAEQWQQISIPFSYVDKNVTPKAILVTASTNAVAGAGSSSDELYLDDITMEYDLAVQNISIKGTALPAFAETTTSYTHSAVGSITADDIDVQTTGTGVIVAKQIESGKATIIVASNDLMQSRTYTINITTGINNATKFTQQNSIKTYNLNGTVAQPNQRGILIQKDANGNARKILKQ